MSSDSEVEDSFVANLRNLNLETDSQISETSNFKYNISLKPSALQNSNQNLQTNMATFNPEYLKCVPVFDGNPNDLNRYLTVCEAIINEFYDNTNSRSFKNVYLLNSLISKLQGNAKLVINIQNVGTWVDVRNTLTLNFADQRDESCLNRDLVMMRQNSHETPQNFYDRILNILNLLCVYVDIHETTDLAKHLKRDLYQNLALKTFLSGLKEPLGTTLRCMKPRSLSEALQYVLAEDNAHYFQNPSSNKSSIKTNFGQTMPNFHVRPQIKPNHTVQRQNYFTGNFPFNNGNTFAKNQNAFPTGPVPIQPRPPIRAQRYFTNNQVFGPRRPQNSYSIRTNVFKPNPNQQLEKPTPMSVCTRNSYSTNRFAQPSTSYNPPANRNFTSEELFNTETQQVSDHNDQFDDASPDQYTYFYDNELGQCLINESTNETKYDQDTYQINADNPNQNFSMMPLDDEQT